MRPEDIKEGMEFTLTKYAGKPYCGHRGKVIRITGGTLTVDYETDEGGKVRTEFFAPPNWFMWDDDIRYIPFDDIKVGMEFVLAQHAVMDDDHKTSYAGYCGVVTSKHKDGFDIVYTNPKHAGLHSFRRKHLETDGDCLGWFLWCCEDHVTPAEKTIYDMTPAEIYEHDCKRRHEEMKAWFTND